MTFIFYPQCLVLPKQALSDTVCLYDICVLGYVNTNITWIRVPWIEGKKLTFRVF